MKKEWIYVLPKRGLQEYEQPVYIYTGWPFMKQLAKLRGSEIKLTANDPYPTFMVSVGGSAYLFNQDGGKVGTMLGTFSAYSLTEERDIREILDRLDLTWEPEIK